MNIDIPNHFTDTDGTEVSGGLHIVDDETAQRWEKEGRGVVQVEATVAAPAIVEAEPEVEAAWQGKVPRATPTVPMKEKAAKAKEKEHGK